MLEGKIVLVTGASRGIGRATALLAAKNHAKVVVNYNKSEDKAA
ncbi:MAG: SDR family NAD(P)-dependent oxidoreductase, partial [Candidatus Thermoplasmatota archaeon]|nr:SDR family NAD(P)-dependent oxidoreductase [Candidatus Thermoplasmatota archaeon]